MSRGMVARCCRRWAVCALAGLAGCVPGDPNSPGASVLEQVLAAPAPRPPAAATHRETESNDNYDTAELVTVDTSVDLIGAIAAGGIDRDLFELGPAAPGDRVQGDLTTVSGADVVLGLLDDRGTLLGFIDPTNNSAGPRQMDVFVRETTPKLYAILTTRSTAASDRSYTARIAIARGAGIPADRPQVVVLVFEGASGVRIAGRSPVDVPVFDAAVIGSRFAGLSDEIVQNVITLVRQSFDGLGVLIYGSGDPAIPGGDHSTVYFGTYDSQLLGLADNVDPYNRDADQSAILFTDTFALFDVLSPSVNEISQVLANTTSHEIGHLLGLRHTADIHDIMDTTANARQMLKPQYFRTSNLHPTVMDFGQQDSPDLLVWAVGGIAPVEPKEVGKQRVLDDATLPGDFHIPRDRLIAGHCGR